VAGELAVALGDNFTGMFDGGIDAGVLGSVQVVDEPGYPVRGENP
jgi:hypothetical protein